MRVQFCYEVVPVWWGELCRLGCRCADRPRDLAGDDEEDVSPKDVSPYERVARGVSSLCRDNAERLRFDDFVKYRYHVTTELDYGLPFARHVGCF